MPAHDLEPTLERTLSGERALPDELPGDGTRIGRLVLLDVIGRGGMGVVYRAYDPVLDRRVAVKLLRSGGQSGDSQGTARLAREAQAMARLSHPNVVAVYDSGVFEQSLFVAMEFVQGVTLAHWLAVAPRTWREVLAMFLQAGRGLMAAHAAGLVHRDFKPTNVLVGEDGRARVTDFGLARATSQEALPPPAPGLPISLEAPLTLLGSVMGTPGYMAPEQYAGRDASPATDQYAFCVALYEALYGHLPFEGNDLQTLARLTQEGQVPPPPRGSPVPAWVAELLRVGLSPDPARRHPSMEVLLKRLDDDPSVRQARRLRAGVVAGLGLLVVAGLWGWPIVRASACHRDTARLAAIWSPSAAISVDQAFAQTGLPFAQTSSSLVRASLDAFAATWVEERDLACEASLRRGEQTARQLSLRLGCLDARRAELATLVDAFQHVTAGTLSTATMAATRLTPISLCTNVEALERRASLDDDRRAAVEALEVELAEGRTLVALGRFDDARRRLEPATAAARELGDAQALALATFEVGSLELTQERFKPARDALTEATRVALTTGDARTAAHAVGLLASVHGWRLDQPKVGLALVDVGRGLAARLDDPFLNGVLEAGRGDSCWRASDNECALRAYEAARVEFERAEGPNGLDVARMHASMGWIRMEEGALLEARREYERARHAREALLGAEHPSLDETWSGLGHLAEELDDRPAAVEAYRTTLRLRQRAGAADPGFASRSHMNLARALTTAGLLQQADEHLSAAASSLDFSSALNRALFERTLSQFLLAKGDPLGAVAAAQRALAAGYDDVTVRGEILSWRGRAQLRLGDSVAGIATLEAAAADYEATGAPVPAYCEVLVELAAARAALDGPGKAAALTERAYEVTRQKEGNVRLKARSALLVARARDALGAQSSARVAAREALSLATDDQVELRAEAARLAR